ncbi:unnamed protein product [Coccothraustes coccothraustes]
MLQRFLEKPSPCRAAGGDEHREKRREGSETAAGGFPYGSQPVPTSLGGCRLGTAPRPPPCAPRLGRVGASRGKRPPPALGPGRRLQGRDGGGLWGRSSGGLPRAAGASRGDFLLYAQNLRTLKAARRSVLLGPGQGPGQGPAAAASPGSHGVAAAGR